MSSTPRNWLGAALVLLLAGCALAPSQSSPSPQGDTQRPRTVIGQLFDRLSPDGTPDKQLALEAFSLVVEPLPGVELPTGPPPEEHELKSATFAVRWLMSYYDDLTPEQKTVVDAALAPAPDAITVHPGESEMDVLAAGFVAAAPGDYQRLKEMLTSAETKIAQRLGRALGSSWSLSIDSSETDYHGLTTYLPAVGCLFNFSPNLTSRAESDIRVVATHEMFHCFQRQILGWESKYNPSPTWITEGMAEFAGEALSGPSATLGLSEWRSYLLSPHTPLYERGYDATGFYWQLAHSGIDPWAHLDAMLRAAAQGNDAVFKASGANSDPFLFSWGSSFSRTAQWGPAWNATALWNTDERSFPIDREVTVGAPTGVRAPALTGWVFQVTTSADIVEVRIDGHARLYRPSSDIVGLSEAWLCTKLGGCACPPGESYNGPTLLTTTSPFYIGMSGSLDDAEGVLTGHDLKEFCEPDDPTPPPDEEPIDLDGCDSGCPMSNGDPHIVTIDDDNYDFMSVGEFVLLRSSDGAFELQARQEPYGESRSVSINTALAMRAGSQRVGIYAIDETLEVRVDGSVVDQTGGPISVGGGTLTFIDGFFPAIEMSFADGTRVTAFGEFQYGINVTIKPGESLQTGSVGLMGPVPDGDGLDVPALPDGTVLPDVLTIQEYEDALYGPFEQAWRVTSASTLFDYQQGASTESYIDESFPDRQALLSFDELTADQRATGEAACVGITDPVLLQQCVYDVFVTGDTTFGEMYEVTVTVVETGALPQTGAQSRVVNLYSEGGQPVDIDVYAWTWSEAEMTEVAALVATVPYGQASDWFNPGLIIGNPFNEAPYTKVTLQRHGEPVDAMNPLTGTMENLGPGTVSTLVIWQEMSLDQPSEYLQTIYSQHPDYEIPQAPMGQGLLLTHNGGLKAEGEPPFLYASVGDGCLEHPLADPTFPFPQPQPIGNHLMIPAGQQTLTIHEGGATGEAPTCETKPLGPGVPVTVSPGDRFFAFPYRLPGAAEINTLVVPFDAQ